MIAYEIDRLVKVFERSFVISFLQVGDAQAKISLRQTAPITGLAITLKRAVRIVARNRVLSDVAIDAGQCCVGSAGNGAFGRYVAQRSLQQRDCFRMVTIVVVSESDLGL